ncbi:SusC/RagA family protein [Arachidicoccus ginsenosidimutans]|uniref:SusC/RagA family TonB-linked outer membrane protein n=1 Tax=Arachidicoccus sp. BS20 TaxID=1850526 RepID=UPI0007F093AD|nr:SusC/RagA family TonB-linked outer membrane protein [Arachidicoccus sp. BS20]ANI90146.1 SusC/RagA family protein [Arachidicoccus sp. BS20]
MNKRNIHYLKSLLIAIVVLCVHKTSFAQDQSQITGTVKSTAGAPLGGVTVTVVNGKAHDITKDDGSFSIKAAIGATLRFAYIGYATKEVIASTSTLNVTLTQSDTASAGNDVVVTALGIKRKSRALGYAVQEVSGQTLADAKEPNLVNDLSGKVAGLQITRSGNGPGGSSQIVLRGNNSISGLSQPLIVVDGVPYDNFTGASNNDFWNPSLDMGNGLSDISADDIASLTVLKGPAAAALYGSRGGNGVIMITTKSGKKQNGLGISVSSSIGIESIFANPKLQKDFSAGSSGVYSPTASTSWGAPIDGHLVEDAQGDSVPLRAYNNVGNYFGDGIISNQSISFQQQFNNTSIYTSYNRMDDKSIIPGAKLTRNNITTRAVTKFGKDNRWSFDAKIQYINSVAKNRPQGGAAVQGNNTFFATYLLPPSIDITSYKKATDENGNMIWYAGGNAQNPYWAAKYRLNSDARDRFLMHGTLKYQFNDWLSAQVEGGSDMYTTNTESKTYAGSPASTTGNYGVGKSTFRETDYSALVTAQKDDVFGKLGGTVSVGGNLMSQYSSYLNSSAGLLVVPNLFTLGNASGYPTTSSGYTNKKINSVYGTLELNYDDYLYLTGTLRNDWSSALSSANRSYRYPSVSLSYVFTDMINKVGGHLPSWISYGKLRASYASAGNDLPAYQLYNTYSIGKDPNGNTTAQRGSVLYNPDIKSELMKSYEAGLEMRFFQSRVGFDLALYKSNATNQIFNLPLDPLSGYSSMKINAGNIQNKGVELVVDAKILDNPTGFGWTITGNYSTNNNTIKALYGDIQKYTLGGYDNLSVVAEVGKKYGEIYGTYFDRVTDKTSPYHGQLIVDNVGRPQAADGSATKDLGNQQASSLLGITNGFTYKNFSLSVLVDARFGGKMFSATLTSLELNGTSALTVVNGRRDSMVVAGVVDNGSGSYAPNTSKISTQQYWTAVAGSGNLGINEANLYDASNIRIRNIQLGYSFNHKMLAKTPFQKAVLSVSMNNVWLISSHMHGMDPESVYATSTNAVGFENGAAPTTRTFYINLNLGF